MEKSCLWYVRNGRTIYKKITRTGNSVNEEINPKDPYVNANYAVLNYLKNRNKGTDGSVIHFAPIVHPILDSQENVERFITHPLTAVVKVHGISSHTGPEEMPEWIPKLATKHNKPLLAHTDYVDRPDNAPSPEIAKLRLMNQPIS